LCFENGEIAGTRGFGGVVEGFDKEAADALADIGEDGGSVGLLPAGEAEGHADSGSMAFADIENQHAAFLIKADDARLLQRAGPDIGPGLLAQSENSVKLS
jgi:hypothetical protein